MRLLGACTAPVRYHAFGQLFAPPVFEGDLVSKQKIAIFVEADLVQRYDTLAFEAGTFRSTLMRHALNAGIEPLRGALASNPTKFAVHASVFSPSAAPSSAPPLGPAGPALTQLRRHLLAVMRANPALSVEELRNFAERELAQSNGGDRPSVDAVEHLVTDLAGSATDDLVPVPGDSPPV